MEICWNEGALFQFDVILSLQELLWCLWLKGVQIPYFHFLLSYGGDPDLSLPWCTVAHKDISAKNPLQCSMRPKATQRTHWGDFSEDRFDAILMKTLSLVLQTCTALGILLQFSLLNTQWKMCSSSARKTEKEFAFRTLKKFFCVTEDHAGTIYKYIKMSSFSARMPFSLWRFSVKKSHLCNSEWHNFQLSPVLIPHGMHAFQEDNRDNLYNLY